MMVYGERRVPELSLCISLWCKQLFKNENILALQCGLVNLLFVMGSLLSWDRGRLARMV